MIPVPAPPPATPRPVIPAPVPTPVPAARILGALSAAPAVVTPGADPSSAYVTVDFTLATDAAVTVRLTGGITPLTLFSSSVPAGASSFSWSLAAAPDGRYLLEVTARPASGAATTQTVPVVVYRSLSGYSVASPLVSPNGDGVNDNAVVGFTLARPVSVQVVLQRAGVPVGDDLLGPARRRAAVDRLERDEQRRSRSRRHVRRRHDRQRRARDGVVLGAADAGHDRPGADAARRGRAPLPAQRAGDRLADRERPADRPGRAGGRVLDPLARRPA